MTCCRGEGGHERADRIQKMRVFSAGWAPGSDRVPCQIYPSAPHSHQNDVFAVVAVNACPGKFKPTRTP